MIHPSKIMVMLLWFIKMFHIHVNLGQSDQPGEFSELIKGGRTPIFTKVLSHIVNKIPYTNSLLGLYHAFSIQ
jgi:hypothetical protein